MTKKNTPDLNGKAELKPNQVPTLDLYTLTLMSEDAFRTRNRVALDAEAPQGDVFDTGQDTVEVKPHWHYARPLESILDGMHKALHGSEYNGRKRKGAVDYRQDLVNALIRKIPLLQQGGDAGADTGALIKAAEQDRSVRDIIDAIGHQDHLIAFMKDMQAAALAAYEVSSNGEEYNTPQQRMAAYQQAEKAQTVTAAQIDALLAAMSK